MCDTCGYIIGCLRCDVRVALLCSADLNMKGGRIEGGGEGGRGEEAGREGEGKAGREGGRGRGRERGRGRGREGGRKERRQL